MIKKFWKHFDLSRGWEEKLFREKSVQSLNNKNEINVIILIIHLQ